MLPEVIADGLAAAVSGWLSDALAASPADAAALEFGEWAAAPGGSGDDGALPGETAPAADCCGVRRPELNCSGAIPGGTLAPAGAGRAGGTAGAAVSVFGASAAAWTDEAGAVRSCSSAGTAATRSGRSRWPVLT